MQRADRRLEVLNTFLIKIGKQSIRIYHRLTFIYLKEANF